MIDLWFLYYGVMGNQNSGGIDIQGYRVLMLWKYKVLEYYSIKNMDNYLSVCLKLCIFDTLNF